MPHRARRPPFASFASGSVAPRQRVFLSRSLPAERFEDVLAQGVPALLFRRLLVSQSLSGNRSVDQQFPISDGLMIKTNNRPPRHSVCKPPTDSGCSGVCEDGRTDGRTLRGCARVCAGW